MFCEHCLVPSEKYRSAAMPGCEMTINQLSSECQTCRNRLDTVIAEIDELVFCKTQENGTFRSSLSSVWQELSTRDGPTPVSESIGPARGLPLEGDELIGRYQLLELINEGGEGFLYRAWDPETSRLVAVKIKPSADLSNAEFWSDEGCLLAQYAHENLVCVYDNGTNGRFQYIVMEWIEGCTLRQLARTEKLSLDEILNLMLQLTSVVEYLHQLGIVHLDLKPDNVMILQREQHRIVKLVDFGLAWNYGRHAPPEDVTAGTPGFMAPEQVEGTSSTWGPPTDVFGLGSILAFLVHGQPREGEFSESNVRDPSEAELRTDGGYPGSNMEAAVWQVSQRATSADPALRFQNGGEFRRALDRVRRPGESGLSTKPKWALLLLIVTFTTLGYPGWICQTTHAVDSDLVPTEAKFHPTTQVIDVTATLTNTPGSELWLWGRTAGAVKWQGVRETLSPSEFQYTSGAGGLEISNSLGPHLAVLAAEFPSRDCSRSLTDQLFNKLLRLAGPWPADARIRVRTSGIEMEELCLAPYEIQVLQECHHWLSAKTNGFDLVVSPD